MANLKDIYYKVGKNLFEQEFDFQTTEQKKKMVDAALKKYLAGKVEEKDLRIDVYRASGLECRAEYCGCQEAEMSKKRIVYFVIFILFVAFLLFAPRGNILQTDVLNTFAGSSAAHPLGTDNIACVKLFKQVILFLA